MSKTNTLHFDMNRFCLSYYLAHHPLLIESKAKKIKYLNVLECFIEKHARNDVICSKVFNNYKKKLLGSNGNAYRRDKDKDSRNFSSILRTRFKLFSFYTLRYVLLYDLIILICPTSKSKIFAITNEIKSLLKDINQKNKMDGFFELMLDATSKLTFIKKDFYLTQSHLDRWRQNTSFILLPLKKIMISSNLSSGKSTLINAITGKRINKSMNEACTSKLHFIYNKPFEDSYIHKYDNDLEMDACRNTLMTDNPKNKKNRIYVASYFNTRISADIRLCLIDSPGVNNSQDKTREKTKLTIVNEQYDLFVFVVNAEYIATTDDKAYLIYIMDKLAGKPVIFILNKLDQYRVPEDDNIAESIATLREFLESIGYENAAICPVSAYAGLMAKRKLYGDTFSEDERAEYGLLINKFSMNEYDLSQYYEAETIASAKRYVEMEDNKQKDAIALLYNSGLLCFETLLYYGGTNERSIY